MDHQFNAADIREQVSLVGLLTRLGHHPIRRSGKEHLYISMLRDSDTNPSLAVNDELGVWYDHGAGNGGNVIDFGLRYWQGLPFPEVLAKIVQIADMPVIEKQAGEEQTNKRRHAQKIPHYQVYEVKELGNNPAITEYLQSRGIWNIAEGKLQEIYYFVEDEKKSRKYFFAAGWQNELGGWEVRNKYFKGCLGLKGLTFAEGKDPGLAVFEGYINYLSWLSDHPDNNKSILVLNSLSLLHAGIKQAASYQTIDLYFDLDKSGEQATREFLQALPQAKDRSAIYAGYNDYNDLLCSKIPSETTTQNPTSALFRSAFTR